MASGAIAIATRGMIFFCPQEEQLISFDKPSVRQTLEVRPKIRYVETPPTGPITHPMTTATIELRPEPVSVEAPAPPADDMKPVPVVAINLRPIIKKIEEE